MSSPERHLSFQNRKNSLVDYSCFTCMLLFCGLNLCSSIVRVSFKYLLSIIQVSFELHSTLIRVSSLSFARVSFQPHLSIFQVSDRLISFKLRTNVKETNFNRFVYVPSLIDLNRLTRRCTMLWLKWPWAYVSTPDSFHSFKILRLCVILDEVNLLKSW